MAGDRVLQLDIRVDAGMQRPPRLWAKLDVSPGITVLFGPSGAGKSTCLVAVAGLVTPSQGRITLGKEVLFDADSGIDLPPDRRRVALVFQSLALFPHMTALQNVAFGISRAIARADRFSTATYWLERMRVTHLAERRPETFSGGEAQRVALARALASGPHVLLLDEPFSAMDAILRQQLSAELSTLIAELSIPTILVTHDREDALRLGTQMVALREGRVVSEGTPEQVLRAPLANT
jgi:ABC-type sulfate/molybdate transport systems ATPase subunit